MVLPPMNGEVPLQRLGSLGAEGYLRGCLKAILLFSMRGGLHTRLYPRGHVWNSPCVGFSLVPCTTSLISFRFQIPRSLPVCPVFPMSKALHTKEKSTCFLEKQSTASSWDKFLTPFPSSSSCRVLEIPPLPQHPRPPWHPLCLRGCSRVLYPSLPSLQTGQGGWE